MITLVTASLTEEGLAALGRYGEVRYQPLAATRRQLKGEAAVQALKGVDVFITEADELWAPEIAALDTLQVICACRGNPVNIDVAAATARGIPVIHAPGRNADAVADLAVTLMVMLGRNIMPAAAVLRGRKPGDDLNLLTRVYFGLRGHEMWSHTVGIVGFGAVGRKVAARLQPFGCRVLAYDPYVSEEAMAACGVRKVELDALLAEADYVTLHAVVTAGTRGMIGARELGLMKPTAYFINTARSALTDEGALLKALSEKRIAGAALDVFDREPLPADSPFLALDNAILLPHIGGATHEVTVHQTQIVVEDVERLLRGEPPRCIINPEVLNSFCFRR